MIDFKTEIVYDFNDLRRHEFFMRKAIGEAVGALEENEVPVGAVIVCKNAVIASAHNQREQLQDPTAHAEMIAVTQAAESLGSWRLEECTLYVTLEPCPMCAGAIVQARIPFVVYGASDPKAGAVASLFQLLNDSRLNHRCEVKANIFAEDCAGLLQEFFRRQRQQGKK
ncbi:MAG: tRNA adenosine(34) deaminase TadA [Planctomycetaceae bacterium]|jgi:tRNA(adenine34) deaminase|nr:tRNA adenosine(34) deaminase TadA [Planctomycetaceae bacterium]